jgi:aspartate aminotransferase
MPRISKRGHRAPPSPIRKLVPFAEQAKRDGKKIYHLNIGQPDIETPELALEAVRHMDRKIIEYSHSAGFESYRRKLVDYYGKHGIAVSIDQIIVTNGGSEAILFACFSCLDAGDEIIIPEPFYANYNGFAVASDVVVKPITSRIEDGFALPPISEFEKLITERTKAIVICNPNNPTGYLYSRQELEALRDMVLRHDLFLFVDEVYREFCYDGRQHVSILTLEGLDQHAVVVDSISKRYSACGARVGTLITRNEQLIATALKFAQARLSPPTLGQILGEAAIDTPDAYFQHVIEEYISRRDLVVNALQAIPGVACPVPGGAFYIMARLPVDDADKFCRWLLEEYSHDGETVMLAPGGGFYATAGLGRNEVRIAYVLNKADLGRAMDCLKEALASYPGRTTAVKVETVHN